MRHASVGRICLLWELCRGFQLLSLVTSFWKVQIVIFCIVLIIGPYVVVPTSACFVWYLRYILMMVLQLLMVVLTVWNYHYYLTLRMHSLLHSTVLQAIAAKLVVSSWSTTDLNLWCHSLIQLWLQHNFCLAMSFLFYLLIFSYISRISYHRVMSSPVLGHVDCWSITDVSEDWSDFIFRVRRCKKSTWPWRWRHYNPFVSDHLLINMGEHPRRLE